MAVSTTTVTYENGYLAISYGTAAEVLADLNTSTTWTGLIHKEHIMGFSQYDATHFSVIYWRSSD